MYTVIVLVAAADLLYGMLVAPFFVENYVWLEWNQSQVYCHIFVYFFTFHDLFAPLLLILLSAYVSLKYSGWHMSFASSYVNSNNFFNIGAIDSVGPKRPVYFACLLLSFLLPLLLAIPATVGSGLAMDNREDILECRTSDGYTMIVTYLVSSSVLFCFAMSFLFSLCIVGSPFLRATIDREEYLQRQVLNSPTTINKEADYNMVNLKYRKYIPSKDPYLTTLYLGGGCF